MLKLKHTNDYKVSYVIRRVDEEREEFPVTPGSCAVVLLKNFLLENSRKEKNTHTHTDSSTEKSKNVFIISRNKEADIHVW